MLSQNPQVQASLSFLLIIIVFRVSYMQGDEENDSEQNQFTGAF